jgi:hypothetical protein
MNTHPPPEPDPAFEETTYYDVDGAAVIWRHGDFPKNVATGGYLYDLADVVREGTRISRDEFEQLLLLIATPAVA